MGRGNQHKKGDSMSNSKLDWIVAGQTVTDSRIAEAAKAGLPEAALAELWKGRTLNKAAVEKINQAKASKSPEPKSEKAVV